MSAQEGLLTPPQKDRPGKPSHVSCSLQLLGCPVLRIARQMRTMGLVCRAPSNSKNGTLKVVIEVELVRNGPQIHFGQLVVTFIANPRVDDVLGEDIAAQQPLVIGFQVVEHFA